jgi:hypothetical protein
MENRGNARRPYGPRYAAPALRSLWHTTAVELARPQGAHEEEMLEGQGQIINRGVRKHHPDLMEAEGVAQIGGFTLLLFCSILPKIVEKIDATRYGVTL